jgi:hypothetical protein
VLTTLPLRLNSITGGAATDWLDRADYAGDIGASDSLLARPDRRFETARQRKNMVLRADTDPADLTGHPEVGQCLHPIRIDVARLTRDKPSISPPGDARMNVEVRFTGVSPAINAASAFAAALQCNERGVVSRSRGQIKNKIVGPTRDP